MGSSVNVDNFAFGEGFNCSGSGFISGSVTASGISSNGLNLNQYGEFRECG
jgi:hypothetical protein